MATSIRRLLNPQLKITEMSSEWWKEQVRALLIVGDGILLAALRQVPNAHNCTRFGLGHGQCVEVPDSKNPITAIMTVMRKRMAVMNGCSFYIQSWDSKMAKVCTFVGIKEIYTNGSPSDEEVTSFKKCGVEVIRVSI